MNKIFVLFLSFIFFGSGLSAQEISGLINCEGYCRLKANPSTIFSKKSVRQAVELSYDFSCNPGIAADSYFPSELRIRDLSNNTSISLDYFHKSKVFTFSTVGPLVVEDLMPFDMADLIQEPCDLKIKISSKVHPDVIAARQKRLKEIDEILPLLEKSLESFKINITLFQYISKLVVALQNLAGEQKATADLVEISDEAQVAILQAITELATNPKLDHTVIPTLASLNSVLTKISTRANQKEAADDPTQIVTDAELAVIRDYLKVIEEFISDLAAIAENTSRKIIELYDERNDLKKGLKG